MPYKKEITMDFDTYQNELKHERAKAINGFCQDLLNGSIEELQDAAQKIVGALERGEFTKDTEAKIRIAVIELIIKAKS